MSLDLVREFSNLLVVLGLVAAACGAAGLSYVRGREVRDHAEALRILKQARDERTTELQARVDALAAANAAVSQENDQLRAQLEQAPAAPHGAATPPVAVPTPAAEPQRRPEAVPAIAASTSGRTRLANGYEFNGVRQIHSGDHVTVMAGPESVVFRRLVELSRAGNFPEVIRLAEAQILRTPDWLTPYLYLGEALASTGRTADAIRHLEYVEHEAGGDAQYHAATELLAQLRRGR